MKILILTILALCGSLASAEIQYRTDRSKFTDNRCLWSGLARNAFGQDVRSARIWVFALDSGGQLVGQKAMWLTGEQGQPWLAAGEETEINLVIRTTSEAQSTQVLFTRIILADGTVINPQEGVAALPVEASPSTQP